MMTTFAQKKISLNLDVEELDNIPNIFGDFGRYGNLYFESTISKKI